MPTVFDEIVSSHELREAEDRARRIAQNRAAAADAVAVECLARTQVPADLAEWGERHRIPEFARATWQAGFIAGWRAFFTLQGLTPPAPPSPPSTHEDPA